MPSFKFPSQWRHSRKASVKNVEKVPPPPHARSEKSQGRPEKSAGYKDERPDGYLHLPPPPHLHHHHHEHDRDVTRRSNSAKHGPHFPDWIKRRHTVHAADEDKPPRDKADWLSRKDNPKDHGRSPPEFPAEWEYMYSRQHSAKQDDERQPKRYSDWLDRKGNRKQAEDSGPQYGGSSARGPPAGGLILQQPFDARKSPNPRRRSTYGGSVRAVNHRTYDEALGQLRSLLATPERHNVAPTKVTDYLYIGSLPNAMDRPLLRRLGITHVLNAAGAQTQPYHKDFFTSEFSYMEIPALDAPNFDMSQFFDDANNFIESAQHSKGKVLVHCVAGINRSGSLVLVHALKSGYPLLQTAAAIKKARGQFLSNESFQLQVVQYARDIGAVV